jgi:hypothetical protein
VFDDELVIVDPFTFEINAVIPVWVGEGQGRLNKKHVGRTTIRRSV